MILYLPRFGEVHDWRRGLFLGGVRLQLYIVTEMELKSEYEVVVR